MKRAESITRLDRQCLVLHISWMILAAEVADV